MGNEKLGIGSVYSVLAVLSLFGLFGFAISPHYASAVEGDIGGVIDSLQFEGTKASSSKIIHISGDVYAIAYHRNFASGQVITVSIDPDGTINGIIASHSFVGLGGGTFDIVKVAGNLYAIPYQASSGGFITAVKIFPSGIIQSTGFSALEYDSRGVNPIARSLGEDILLAYEDPLFHGATIKINFTGTDGEFGIPPKYDKTEIVSSFFGTPDFAIPGSTFPIAYTGIGDDGFLAPSGFEFDGSQGKDPDIIPLSGGIFAVVYAGPGDDGFLKTLTETSVIESLEFDTGRGRTPDITPVSGDVYVIAYQNDINRGILKTIPISGTGSIGSEIDFFRFDTINGLSPDVIHVSGDVYAIAYTGSLGRGFLKTVNIGTDLTPVDTDGDGLLDDDEINIYGTNPNLADTDGDTLSDGDEVLVHLTDPLKPDTDDDTLNDGAELALMSPTNPLVPDTDEDGLLDGWEVLGIDGDGDTNPDFMLDGADPLHQDIYVEFDYMEFHKPSLSAINNVITAFDEAPVGNPDLDDGINLHVDFTTAEQIDHDIDWVFGRDNWPDFEDEKTDSFGTTTEKLNPDWFQKIRPAKLKAYHYALFIHNMAGTGASGIGDLPGDDFVVSLQQAVEDKNHDSNHVRVGSEMVEGTFMHELGHNLGLYHGGHIPDDINGNMEVNDFEDLANNCKPNHLSVMSYSFQFPYASITINGVDRPLDYSRSELSPLNETSLDEPTGIDESVPIGLFTIYGPGENTTGTQTGIPVDWDDDNLFTSTSVKRNISAVDQKCGLDTQFTELTGHNDWENLDLDFNTSPNSSPGIHPSPDDIIELTVDEILEEESSLNTIPSNKDSFLRQGAKNTNEGANEIMRIKASGNNRALVEFDQNAIELAAIGGTLQNATLRLYIVENGNNWGKEGRTIGVNAVVVSWEEGDGANSKPKHMSNQEFKEFKNRGDGSGVTWKCAIDSEINNQKADCDPKWNGGTFIGTPTDTVRIFKDFSGNNKLPQTTKTVGWIEFDVTADVQEFLDGTMVNNGWIIKKTEEGQSGKIEIATKEASENQPELRLIFE